MSDMQAKHARKPKPKTHDAVLSIRLPPRQREAIEDICSRRGDGPSLAQWVREAIAAKLERERTAAPRG